MTASSPEVFSIYLWMSSVHMTFVTLFLGAGESIETKEVFPMIFQVDPHDVDVYTCYNDSCNPILDSKFDAACACATELGTHTVKLDK